MRKQKGFTLIELLVVIAIIGLLSTLAVVALNNARAKSRDARRLSDVKQMQTAMELYFNDCGSYPASTTPGGTIAQNDGTCTGTVTYMAVVPNNPQPRNDGGCDLTGGGALSCGGVANSAENYCYVPDDMHNSAGDIFYQSYHLVYCIGQDNNNITGGSLHCATPAGIVEDGGTDCP